MDNPTFKTITFPIDRALELSAFREMDYYAVENYSLPIELMMENAGLQLANLVASFTNKDQIIKMGIGNGNNGGGGLVAARRLAAWGYAVHLDLTTEITKELPKTQLERATRFGATTTATKTYDVWVDAYLGFSQRLPLYPALRNRILEANKSDVLKVSLDIPTGFLGDTNSEYFQCDKVLTLAAPKKILYYLPDATDIYVSDLGIPAEVYKKFNVALLPFSQSNILNITRKTSN